MTAVEVPATDVTESAGEWQLRVELAATFRIFALLGWDEMIFNHISVRVPGEPATYLMNPFGLLYEEITAPDLIRVDLDGALVEPSPHRPNPAGFLFHGAIHREISGAHCVMHTHSTAGSAVACLDSGMSPDNFYASQLRGGVAYHDFEGITVHAGEVPRMLTALGDRRALVLRNHGLLAVGTDLADALYRLWVLERACAVQLAAQGSGRPLRAVTEAAAATSAAAATDFLDSGVGPQRLMFEALLRKAHRESPGFDR